MVLQIKNNGTAEAIIPALNNLEIAPSATVNAPTIKFYESVELTALAPANGTFTITVNAGPAHTVTIANIVGGGTFEGDSYADVAVKINAALVAGGSTSVAKVLRTSVPSRTIGSPAPEVEPEKREILQIKIDGSDTLVFANGSSTFASDADFTATNFTELDVVKAVSPNPNLQIIGATQINVEIPTDAFQALNPVILEQIIEETNQALNSISSQAALAASYTPAVPAQYAGTPPSTVKQALDRLTAAVYTLQSNTPIA